MNIKSIFRIINVIIPIHTCRKAELDYYSDCGSCSSCSFGRHCDEPKTHAESMRGQYYGQGDQCWAFYCKGCGKCVKLSYYIEAMNFKGTDIDV